MGAAFSIRPAEPEDAPTIQRVARAAWHEAYDAILGAERVDETVDSWYDPERLVTDDIEPSHRPFFVATDGGELLGFAEAVPDDGADRLGHLYRIYVEPNHWGEGIGTALLDRLETTAVDRGFERLQLTVMAENDVGVSFYEGSGFRRDSTRYNDQLGIEEYEYRKEL